MKKFSALKFLTLKFFTLVLYLGITLLLAAPDAGAQSVLVSDGTYANGYGRAWWSNMTAAMNTATENSVDVVSNFEDLPGMLGYDALWLDYRNQTSVLGDTEKVNISTFIATGRRLVMIGEHNSWETWNNSILDIVGGSHSGDYDGVANTAAANDLTQEVSTVKVPYGGTTNGGDALFDVNFATLWGENNNVLTILDGDFASFMNWNSQDNAQFSTNVAGWIADSGDPVPIPGAIWLLGSGLLGLAGIQRKK